MNHAGQGNVEPRDAAIGEHHGSVVRIDKGAAAGGDDELALGQQFVKDLALDLAKIGLAIAGEDTGNAASFALLDALVDVGDTPPDAAAERPSDGRFAGPHESDQIQLVG